MKGMLPVICETQVWCALQADAKQIWHLAAESIKAVLTSRPAWLLPVAHEFGNR